MNEIETTKEKVPAGVQPACSICEEEDQVVLRLEMPGVNKDGITIQLEKNELVITGRREDSKEQCTYLIRERRTGEYRKSFVIDESIDQDTVKASMIDGVLTLELSTKEAAKPRKITIG